MGIIISTDLNEIKKKYKGNRIAIVGQGQSMTTNAKSNAEKVKMTHPDGSVTYEYFRIKDLRTYRHPVWTLNGGWYYHPQSELGFHMDSFKIIGESELVYDEWYKKLYTEAKLPVISSETHPDYPCSVEYPLLEVLEYFGDCYFAETVDYMIALAIMWGVERIDLIGCDYQGNDRYPGERSCAEYWCMEAHLSGVELGIQEESALMKVGHRADCQPQLYGYHLDNDDLDEKKLNSAMDRGNKRIRKENGITSEYKKVHLKEKHIIRADNFVEGPINVIVNPKQGPIPISIKGTNNRSFMVDASIEKPVRIGNWPPLIQELAYTWKDGDNEVLGLMGKPEIFYGSEVMDWHFYMTCIHTEGLNTFKLLPSQANPLKNGEFVHPNNRDWKYVGFHRCLNEEKVLFKAMKKVGFEYINDLEIDPALASQTKQSGMFDTEQKIDKV